MAPGAGDMAVFYNGGGLQVFYDWKRDPVEVPTRFVADIEGVSKASLDRLNCSLVDSVEDCLADASSVLLVRNFALGDVLMLIPVVRELRERYPDKIFSLATRPEITESSIFLELVDGAFDAVGNYHGLVQSKYDLGILLDGILERDHRIREYSRKHRVDIYREFLGLPTRRQPVWSLQTNWIGRSGGVFCSGGRNRVKQLPKPTAEYITKKLRGRGFRKVLHVCDDLRVPDADLLKAMRDARVLVTMDTAPLWIAHFLATPTVLITGPTRGSERLSYHPLYPDGVYEISLSRAIGCEPCFESRSNCDGEVRCMKADHAYIWEEIEKGIDKVMWKER